MSAVTLRGMDRVQENNYFLQALQKTKSYKQRKYILKHATRDQIITLAEIVANYLAGNLKINDPSNYRLYLKQKRYFRILGHSGRKSWVKRKQAALKLGKLLVKFLGDVESVLP